MAPALVQADDGDNSGTSVALALASGATEDNLLVTAISGDKSLGTCTPPSGFSSVEAVSGSSTSLHVAYKVAAGGEQNLTWTTGTGDDAVGWVGEYSGIDPADPFDVEAAAAYNDTAVASISRGPITPATDGLVVGCWAIDTPVPTTGTTDVTLPAGHTERLKRSHASSGQGPALAVSDKVATEGVAESATWTPSNTDQQHAYLVIFNAAAVSDTDPPETTITSGPGEGSTVTAGTTVTFVVTADEASTFEYRRQQNGGAFTSWTAMVQDTATQGSIEHTAIAAGTWGYEFRATDTASNVDASPATRSFTAQTASGGATSALRRRRVTPRLHVSIDGRTTRVSTLEYSCVDGGGFEAASMTIAKGRTPEPGAPVQITDGTEIAWEGVIEEPGQRHGRDQAANVTAVGEGVALKRNPYTCVYLDRRVSAWQTLPPDQRRALLISSSYDPRAAESVLDPGGGGQLAGPSLLLDIKGSWAGRFPIVEPWYHAPPGTGLRELRAAWRLEGDANPADPAWEFGWIFTDDADGATSPTGANVPVVFTAGIGTDTLRIPEHIDALEHLFVNWYFQVDTAGVEGETYGLKLRPLVIGDHPVTVRGTGLNGYVTPEDVAADAVRRSGANLDPGRIDTSGFPVTQLVYDQRTEPERVLAEMAGLLGWHWGVWERTTLGDRPTWHFHAPPSEPTARVFYDDVADLDLTERLSTLHDTAIVSYQDGAGNRQEVTVTVPNPRLRAGMGAPLMVDAGTSNADAAALLGRLHLAAELLGRHAGSGRLPPLTRGSGAGRPSHLLRPGRDRLQIVGLPTPAGLLEGGTARTDTFRLRRITVTLESGAPRTRAEFDSGADLIEVLQARLAVAQAAQGG